MSQVRISGAWRSIAYGMIYVAGSWKRVLRHKEYIGGAWVVGETYAETLTVSLDFDEVNAITSNGGSAITPVATMATPAGGIAPFTYSWARTSGIGTVLSPSSASTVFAGSPGSGNSATGTFVCTVSDSSGQSVASDPVTVLFIDIVFPPGI